MPPTDLLQICYIYYMVIITKCPGTVNSKTLSDFTKYSMNILCIFISIKKTVPKYRSHGVLWNCFSYLIAIASISSITSFGRRATSTQLLDGKSAVKKVLYTSLMALKSFISLMNTVVLTTLSILVPAASSKLERLVSACFA